MTKKTMLIAAMAMVMGLSTTAMAAESTITKGSAQTGTVTLEYTQDKAYNVTIPADISFGAANDAAKTVEISANGVVIDNGESLTVTVSSGNYDSTETSKGWYLVDAKEGASDNKLEYFIKKDSVEVQNGGTILNVNAGTAQGSATLSLTGPVAAAKSGTYKDTLTFTVEVK